MGSNVMSRAPSHDRLTWVTTLIKDVNGRKNLCANVVEKLCSFDDETNYTVLPALVQYLKKDTYYDLSICLL